MPSHYTRNRPTGRTEEQRLVGHQRHAAKAAKVRDQEVREARDEVRKARATEAESGIQPVGSGLGRRAGQIVEDIKRGANKLENKALGFINRSAGSSPGKTAGVVTGSALTRRQRITNATKTDRSQLGQHPNAPKPENDIDWEKARKHAKPRPLPRATEKGFSPSPEDANTWKRVGEMYQDGKLTPGEREEAERMLGKYKNRPGRRK